MKTKLNKNKLTKYDHPQIVRKFKKKVIFKFFIKTKKFNSYTYIYSPYPCEYK